MKTIIAAVVAALATIGAAAPADAAPKTHKKRICYTINDVRRCHVTTVHVVHRGQR